MGNTRRFEVQANSSAQVSYVNRVCLDHNLHSDMEMRIIITSQTGNQCRATGRRQIYRDACLDVAGCDGIQEGEQCQIQFRQYEGKTVTAPSQHTYIQSRGGTLTYKATGDLIVGNAFVDKFRFDARGVWCGLERCGPGKFWPNCGTNTLSADPLAQVPDDHKTCYEFDFPIILSGHDHHKVDEVVEGTRLVKPGMDGVYASVVELIWHEPKQSFDSSSSSQSPSPKTTTNKKSPAKNRKNSHTSLQGAQRVSDESMSSSMKDTSDRRSTASATTAPNHHYDHHPDVRSTFVEVSTFEPCPILKAQTDKAYDVLLPLQESQLIRVPPRYEPLSSRNARGSVCTMGSLICSLLKAMLNQKMKSTIDPSWSEALTQAVIRQNQIDAVLLMGGNIRGGEDYPPGSFFSLKMLEAEIKSDEVVAVVPIPGSVLAQGIEATHAGDPIPGWMQYDDGIQEQRTGDGILRVTMVGGQPLDPNRTYRVATKISDLRNGQSPPLKNYFTLRPDLLPAKGSYFNIQTELMSFFARNIFRKLWEATQTPHLQEEVEQQTASIMGREVSSENLQDAATMKKVESGLRLAVLDQKGDGIVSVEEIHSALRNILGLSVSDDNLTLARYVHSQADVTGDGLVTRRDFEQFCTAGGLPAEFGNANDKWDEAFPGPTNLEADSNEIRETFSKDDSTLAKTEATLLDHQWQSGSASGDYDDDDDDVGLMI